MYIVYFIKVILSKYIVCNAVNNYVLLIMKLCIY